MDSAQVTARKHRTVSTLTFEHIYCNINCAFKNDDRTDMNLFFYGYFYYYFYLFFWLTGFFSPRHLNQKQEIA